MIPPLAKSTKSVSSLAITKQIVPPIKNAKASVLFLTIENVFLLEE